MTAIKRISALARPIVFSCLTNRIIVFVSLAAFAAMVIYQLTSGTPFFSALVAGAGTGFALFLSWALGREIDPANDWSAFAALPFIFAAAPAYGAPALLPLLFLIFIGRGLSRSAGEQLTILDSIMLVVFGMLLFFNGVVSAPVFLAAVFLLDAVLVPVNRKQLYFALLAAAAIGLSFPLLNSGQPGSGGFVTSTGIFALLLIAAAGFVIAVTGQDRVAGDSSGWPLENRRIALTQAAVAAIIVTELALKGYSALLVFYPAVLSYLGIALYHLLRILKTNIKVIA